MTGAACTILHGDSREVLRRFPAASLDACVTDPPYGLSFMGRAWDYDVPKAELWREVFRVLKPGAHLVAFFGTRTYHRGVCAIEDAGFDVRDQLAWLYGSGFPKSHDVSKGIDRAAGAEREVVGSKRAGLARKARGGGDMVGCASFEEMRTADLTVPATPEAERWRGWGTALKPALEPICLARKPLIGTVAANVLEHGTGALNIDGCRVGTSEDLSGGACCASSGVKGGVHWSGAHDRSTGLKFEQPPGRWPANVIHDGSDEVVDAFPAEAGGAAGIRSTHARHKSVAKGAEAERVSVGYQDAGGAARFFYSAKADATDRLGSEHPTVKPVDLMAWLCRLVTPPGGVVLDPFAGSGSTGVAALSEGFSAVLVEREAVHVADCERRLANWRGEISARDAVLARKLKAVSEAKRAGNDTPLFASGS